MISEGSCDTEDWSNDAENSVKLQFIIYLHRKCYFKIEKYFPFVLQFLLHCLSNKCSLGKQKTLFSITISYRTQTLEQLHTKK